MPSYKISQLNPVSTFKPTSLIPIAETGSTKKAELSALFKAFVDGSLSPNPTSPTSVYNQSFIINHDLSVNGNTTLGNNSSDNVVINGQLTTTNNTTLGNDFSDVVNINGSLRVNNLVSGNTNTVVTKNATSNALEIREINSQVWNTGVTFLTSTPSSGSGITLTPPSPSAPIVLGGGTNTTIVSGSLVASGNTILGNDSSNVTTINGTLSTTGNTVLGNGPTDVTTVNGTLSTTGNTVLGNDSSDVTTINGTLKTNGNLTVVGYISATQDVFSQKIFLTSPDGTQHDLSIDNSGVLNRIGPLPPFTPVLVSSTAPVGANEGDLWYDEINGVLSIYFISSGGSSQWIEIGDSNGGGGGGSGPLTIEKDSAILTANATSLNFTGGGVSATNSGGTVTINVPGGGSSLTVQDEGSNLTTNATSLNFTGPGITASNSGGAVTVNALVAPLTVKDEGSIATTNATSLNFTGPGVTAVHTGLGGIDINIPGSSGGITNVSGTAPISVANGTTAPSISIAAATTSAAGTMSFTDKTRLDSASGVTGLVKCNGFGNFSAAVAGTDYLTSSTTGQIKAWVNFNGEAAVYTSGNTVTYTSNTPIAGQTTVTIDRATAWSPLPSVGDFITVSGVTGATSVNGTFQITSVNNTSFNIQYIVPSVVSGTVGGTAVVRVANIRSSYNVSSITRYGIGEYSINFATPMSNTNYSIAGAAQYSNTGSTGRGAFIGPFSDSTSPYSTNSVKIQTTIVDTNAGIKSDLAFINVIVCGN